MARGRMIRPKATASRCARNFIPGTSYISLEGRDTHIERNGMEKNKKYEYLFVSLVHLRSHREPVGLGHALDVPCEVAAGAFLCSFFFTRKSIDAQTTRLRASIRGNPPAQEIITFATAVVPFLHFCPLIFLSFRFLPAATVTRVTTTRTSGTATAATHGTAGIDTRDTGRRVACLAKASSTWPTAMSTTESKLSHFF